MFSSFLFSEGVLATLIGVGKSFIQVATRLINWIFAQDVWEHQRTLSIFIIEVFLTIRAAIFDRRLRIEFEFKTRWAEHLSIRHREAETLQEFFVVFDMR